MMHPENTSAILLSGVDGLLSAVPALLGFHPEDSVVLLCLSGPRRRIGPVIRVDLEHGQVPAGAAGQLAGYAARFADETMVITFTDHPMPPDTTALMAALRAVCPVVEVVAAGNRSHPVPEQLLAAAALSGRAVLADREALARSVEHHPTAATVRPEVLELMRTSAGRDRYLMGRRGHPVAVAELLTAAQGSTDREPSTPNVCAALALVAYRHGDGALAQVAVDRTLRIDPHHRLAHLLLAVMAAALPPADLDAVLTALQADHSPGSRCH